MNQKKRIIPKYPVTSQRSSFDVTPSPLQINGYTAYSFRAVFSDHLLDRAVRINEDKR